MFPISCLVHQFFCFSRIPLDFGKAVGAHSLTVFPIGTDDVIPEIVLLRQNCPKPLPSKRWIGFHRPCKSDGSAIEVKNLSRNGGKKTVNGGHSPYHLIIGGRAFRFHPVKNIRIKCVRLGIQHLLFPHLHPVMVHQRHAVDQHDHRCRQRRKAG